MLAVAGGILLALFTIFVLVGIGEIAARRSEFKEDRHKTEQWRKNGYRWPNG